MKIYKLSPNFTINDLKNNPHLSYKNNRFSDQVTQTTLKIINEVKLKGDKALIDFTNNYDNNNFSSPDQLILSQQEIESYCNETQDDIKEALKESYNRIAKFHQKQMPNNNIYYDNINVKLGNIWKPISKIAIYAPGGTASYPSSVLMSAIPAIIAGAKDLILLTPANSNKINPAIIYAAKLCNISKIYKIGGAQAIAAAAFGTNIIDAVDKIVGPGNSYVACAKKELYGEVGIDMIAGPTDITIIAQKNIAKAKWVAIDAISQLEHGQDSKAFIICDEENFANEIYTSINQIVDSQPRKNIINKSLQNSAIIIVNDINNSAQISNFIAPEHLQIISDNNDNLLSKINNAGAVFLGNYTPEAIGDYIGGPSHTLPTQGNARFSSGLSVYDFLKRISLIESDKKSFFKISQHAKKIAQSEGLYAHKLSLEIRNED